MRNGKLAQAAFNNAKDLVSEQDIDFLVDVARSWIRSRCLRFNPVFGWSGGKDSVALRYVIEPFCLRHVSTGAGVFEFVEWRRFVSSVETDIYDHPSLVNPKRFKRSMIFPTDKKFIYEWFKLSNQYSWHASGAKHIVVGKRTQDGNCCGTDGVFSDRTGLIQFSPLSGWRHEHVAALIQYKNLPMSPMYSWFDGFETTDNRWSTRPVRTETNLDPMAYIRKLSEETYFRAESFLTEVSLF